VLDAAGLRREGVEAVVPSTRVARGPAKWPRGILAAGIICALAALALSAQASGQVKQLRLSHLSSYGAGSKFTARAPGGWKIKTPRSSCVATGEGSGGARRRAYVLRAGGRGVTFAFRTPEVTPPLSVDCRKLTKTVIRTKVVKKWVRRASERRGTDVSSTDRKGNCHVNRLFGDLQVDCWGGRYAEAVYRFNLPGDARHINRWAHGTVDCCDRGRLSRDWVDKGGNDLAYRVVVTGWRAYTIRRVGVSYKTKVKRRVRVKHVKRAAGHGERG